MSQSAGYSRDRYSCRCQLQRQCRLVGRQPDPSRDPASCGRRQRPGQDQPERQRTRRCSAGAEGGCGVVDVGAGAVVGECWSGIVVRPHRQSDRENKAEVYSGRRRKKGQRHRWRSRCWPVLLPRQPQIGKPRPEKEKGACYCCPRETCGTQAWRPWVIWSSAALRGRCGS